MEIVNVINTDPCLSGAYVSAEGPGGTSVGVGFGDSGSPLYVENSAGHSLLVGLAQSITKASSGKGSSFIRIDSSFVVWVMKESGVTLTKACP